MMNIDIPIFLKNPGYPDIPMIAHSVLRTSRLCTWLETGFCGKPRSEECPLCDASDTDVGVETYYAVWELVHTKSHNYKLKYQFDGCVDYISLLDESNWVQFMVAYLSCICNHDKITPIKVDHLWTQKCKCGNRPNVFWGDSTICSYCLWQNAWVRKSILDASTHESEEYRRIKKHWPIESQKAEYDPTVKERGYMGLISDHSEMVEILGKQCVIADSPDDTLKRLQDEIGIWYVLDQAKARNMTPEAIVEMMRRNAKKRLLPSLPHIGDPDVHISPWGNKVYYDVD